MALAPFAFTSPFDLWLTSSTQEEDILEMAILSRTSKDGFPKPKVAG